MKFVQWFSLLIGTMCVGLVARADLTYMHPAENNGQENITLSSGTHDFTVDADPNGNHYVEWFNTYSGTDGRIDNAFFYYYDSTGVGITKSGWVRAEVYKSDIYNNVGAWEASYRWCFGSP